jgi:hypothetical protein
VTAKTTAERQRALRQARADAGLVEVRGVWLHPEDHASIKALAAKLQRKRMKDRNDPRSN